MAFTDANRQLIFDTIKAELQACCPPMVVSKTNKDNFEITGNKEVPYGYKKELISGMFFASVVARKDKVCMYFFCNYTHPKAFATMAPSLFKCLKGKSCFHFKKMEEIERKELQEILQLGIKIWKEEGYIK